MQATAGLVCAPQVGRASHVWEAYAASPTADCFRILVGIQDSPRRGHFSTTPSRPNEHTAQNGRSAGVSNFTPNIQWRIDARRFSACAALPTPRLGERLLHWAGEEGRKLTW